MWQEYCSFYGFGNALRQPSRHLKLPFEQISLPSDGTVAGMGGVVEMVHMSITFPRFLSSRHTTPTLIYLEIVFGGQMALLQPDSDSRFRY